MCSKIRDFKMIAVGKKDTLITCTDIFSTDVFLYISVNNL